MAAAETEISDYPCAVCMGFCLEDSNCIRCDVCMNWFHRECEKLSKSKFEALTNDTSSKYTCTICIHRRKCELCNRSPRIDENFLYCVTCLKHFCIKGGRGGLTPNKIFFCFIAFFVRVGLREPPSFYRM